MTQQNTVKLRVPNQDLDQSSFFDCEEGAVADWVSALPMANLGQSTRQLYQALNELNRVRLLPDQRLLLLEQLRTPVYFVTRALEKYYLNQGGTLSEQAGKVVDLSHALHEALATGYTLVITHTATLGDQSGISNPRGLAAQAIHRATTDLTVNMVRYFQLYEPVDPSIWQRLHQLYLLASQYQTLAINISDNEWGQCTVVACYIRALLLGSAKPNQLRQEDFKHLLKPITQWAAYCTLGEADGNCLFVINPEGDSRPVYRSLCETEINERWMGLNLSSLVEHLTALGEQGGTKNTPLVDGDINISRELNNHLLTAWSSLAKRSFSRVDMDETLTLCLGLSASHHYLINELNFDAFIEGDGDKSLAVQQENPFIPVSSHQSRKKDVWDSPYENNMGKINVSQQSINYEIQQHLSDDTSGKNKFSNQKVKLVNASAHGYCVQWPTDVAVKLQTGEIAAIKDSHNTQWNITVIRWIGQENGCFQLGLELLSPNVSPYAARVIPKTGAPGDFMRVMMLPEIISINQAATLITPSVPFREQQKVELNQQGKKLQVRLGKRLNTLGNFNQFEFIKLSGANTPEPRKSDGDFDSLWENL